VLAIFSGRLTEEIVKRNLCIGAITLALLVPALYASESQTNSKQVVNGTVVGVQENEVLSPETIGGSNPSDAQLTKQSYAYDVSVRVDCKTYVGRYQTPFEYLPSAFTAGQPIQLRLTRHVMYFDLPNNSEMRMGIVHRATDAGACSAAR